MAQFSFFVVNYVLYFQPVVKDFGNLSAQTILRDYFHISPYIFHIKTEQNSEKYTITDHITNLIIVNYFNDIRQIRFIVT